MDFRWKLRPLRLQSLALNTSESRNAGDIWPRASAVLARSWLPLATIAYLTAAIYMISHR